jgi:hypothetical protein
MNQKSPGVRQGSLNHNNDDAIGINPRRLFYRNSRTKTHAYKIVRNGNTIAGQNDQARSVQSFWVGSLSRNSTRPIDCNK